MSADMASVRVSLAAPPDGPAPGAASPVHPASSATSATAGTRADLGRMRSSFEVPQTGAPGFEGQGFCATFYAHCRDARHSTSIACGNLGVTDLKRANF